jgi:hypothetical protein
MESQNPDRPRYALFRVGHIDPFAYVGETSLTFKLVARVKFFDRGLFSMVIKRTRGDNPSVVSGRKKDPQSENH